MSFFNEDSFAPQPPVGQGQPGVSAPPEASPGFLDYITDIPMGIARGAVSFGESLFELADAGAELVGGDLFEGQDLTWSEDLLGENKTFVGGLTQGITQFAMGFVPAAGILGKVNKLNKLRKSGLAGRIAFDSLAGIPADLVAFNGHEGRLADLIEQYPALQNPVSSFLSTDEDDRELEGRFKNAVEGAIAGPIVDTLLSGLRFLRGAKKAEEAGGVKGREDWIAKNQEKYAAELEKIENPLTELDLRAQMEEAKVDADVIDAEMALFSARAQKVGVDTDTYIGLTVDSFHRATEPSSDALHQSVPIRVGAESLELEGKNLENIQASLQKQAESKLGRRLDMNDPEDLDLMVEQMYDEVKFEMDSAGVDSGKSWYGEDMKKAWNEAIAIEPRLTEDPSNKGLFKTLLAITSQQNDVGKNAEWALRAFRGWVNSGKKKFLDASQAGAIMGRSGNTIAQQFRGLEELLDRWGLDKTVKWLNTEHTGREIRDVKRTLSSFSDNATIDARLGDSRMGSLMFGPKVGEFAQNVNGNTVRGTFDVWWTRTVRRLEGNLDSITFQDKVTKKGKKVRAEVGAAPKGPVDRRNMQKLAERVADKLGVETADLQAIAWYYEKRLYNSVGYNVDVESFHDAFKRIRTQEEGPAFNRVREDARTGSARNGDGSSSAPRAGSSEATSGDVQRLRSDRGRSAITAEVLRTADANPYGYTFDPRTGRTLELADIPDGYAIALHGHELRVPLDAGPEQYEQYVKQLAGNLEDPNLFIGGWKNKMLDGSEAPANVLDLTTVFRGSLDDAKRFAQDHGQEEIWDGTKTIRVFHKNAEENTTRALRIREALASEQLKLPEHQTGQAIPKEAYRDPSLNQKDMEGEIKGEISFVPDGRAVIKLFETADASTVLHESGHLFRRDLKKFNPELEEEAQRLFGVGPEGWTREKEEAFAESFESYLKDGKAPNPTLKKVFDQFKTWLSDIYSKISGTKAGDKISPEVRDFFDEMLGGRTAVQRNLDIPVKVRESIAQQLSAVTRGEVELDQAVEGLDLNFDKLLADVEAKELMNIVSRELSDQIGKLKGGVETLEATKAKALKTLEQDLDAPEGLLDRIQAGTTDAKDIIAAKVVVNSLSQKIVSLGRKMDLGNGTKRDTAELLRHIEEMAHLQADLKANITNAARITSAGRIPIETSLTSAKLDELIIRAGGDGRLRDIVKHIKMTDGNPRDVTRVVAKRWDTKGRKVIDVHNEVWLNSILSGPITHAVNLISTLTHGLARSAEKGLGGALTLNPKVAREGMDELAGLLFATKDSVKFAFKSLKSGDSILDIGNATLDAPTGSITGRGGKSPKAMGLDFIGNIVRLPSRFLQAEDELNKQLFYRSHLFAKGIQDAKRVGIPSGSKRIQHAQEFIQKSIDENGRALDESALYHAQEGTFTNDLGYGVGQSLQKFVNKHPVTRLMLPFVRTPTNIFRQLWRHTPGLGMWQRQWAEDFHSGDPARRALAVGQQVVGATLLGGGVMAASSGRITGGGPSDHRELALLRQTGWQPYSIVTTGADGKKKYTSYQRLDPFASAIGLVADYVEIGNRIDPEDQQELAVGMMAAFAKNITNKTYLRGLAEAVDVLTDPDRNVERWMQRQVGSYVPNFFNQTNPDDTLREVRTYMDAIKSKTPGYSETLDPRRNVFGQPISFEGALGPDFVSPFYQSTGLSSPARDELVDLELAMGQPREEVQPGLDLTQIRVSANQTAYDRWLELVGQVKVNNKGLEEYLNDLVQSEAYQRLPAQSTMPTGIDSSRAKYVKRAVTRYRQRALMEMLKQNPDLKQFYQEAAVNARRISVLGAQTPQ